MGELEKNMIKKIKEKKKFKKLMYIYEFHTYYSASLTLGLAIGMVNVDVHGPMQGADQGALVGTQTLMSSVDGLRLPVGPVDILLKQSHGKDVGDVLAENCEAPDKH